MRDLRLGWACEEADHPYAVRTIPFDGRETNHLARQPFGQVPFLSDGEQEIFESGAGPLHLRLHRRGRQMSGRGDSLDLQQPSGIEYASDDDRHCRRAFSQDFLPHDPVLIAELAVGKEDRDLYQIVE